MEKTKVVNIIGASGSGKTTIAKKLDKEENINIIQSYTTREPRSENEWGHTFIEDYEVTQYNDLDVIIDNIYLVKCCGPEDCMYLFDDMIAYFNSYKSGHHYFATDEQVIRGKTNIYIVDVEGARQVHEFYKDNEDIEVLTVYLQVDYEIREKRMTRRTVADKNEFNSLEVIKEVAHRLEADKELFKAVKCDYVVDGNQSIEEILELIKEVIKQ